MSHSVRDPQDLSEESRLLFFATYTLERMRQRGLIETSKNAPLLTPKEYKFVQDMIQANLCTFEDVDVQAALLYCATAGGVKESEAEIMKGLRTMLAQA